MSWLHLSPHFHTCSRPHFPVLTAARVNLSYQACSHPPGASLPTGNEPKSSPWPLRSPTPFGPWTTPTSHLPPPPALTLLQPQWPACFPWHSKHIPAPGPLHLLFPLPGIASSKDLQASSSIHLYFSSNVASSEKPSWHPALKGIPPFPDAISLGGFSFFLTLRLNLTSEHSFAFGVPP